MNQKTIILFVLLFAVIVVGMFVYAHLKKQELTDTPEPTNEVPAEESVLYPNITRIDGTHYYIEGEHTIVGEILFPTPCDLLEVDALVAESFPEQITLNFNVINNAESCAQVVTPQRYKVTVSASPDATFAATFMGREIPLNLRPAPEGETPEDFELFIKG